MRAGRIAHRTDPERRTLGSNDARRELQQVGAMRTARQRRPAGPARHREVARINPADTFAYRQRRAAVVVHRHRLVERGMAPHNGAECDARKREHVDWRDTGARRHDVRP